MGSASSYGIIVTAKAIRAAMTMKETLAAASLEADVVAGLIVEMLDGGSGWTGTAKDLLAQVDSRATDQQKRSKHWPKTPDGMASRLRRASEILRAQGWTVGTTRAPRADRSRTITIAPAPDKAGPGSSTSSASPKPNDPKGLDADNGDTPIVHTQPHRPIVHTSSTSNPFRRAAVSLSNGDGLIDVW